MKSFQGWKETDRPKSYIRDRGHTDITQYFIHMSECLIISVMRAIKTDVTSECEHSRYIICTAKIGIFTQ